MTLELEWILVAGSVVQSLLLMVIAVNTATCSAGMRHLFNRLSDILDSIEDGKRQ